MASIIARLKQRVSLGKSNAMCALLCLTLLTAFVLSTRLSAAQDSGAKQASETLQEQLAELPLLPEAEALPEIYPKHVIAYSGSTSIGDVVFTQGDRVVSNLVDILGVHLWSLFVYYWPEYLCLIVLIVCLALFRRALMRRRWTDIGEPYCRKCNYQLTGCNSDRCPECGADISGGNRVISRRARLHPITWLIIPVILVPTFLWSCQHYPTRFVRKGSVSNLIRWFSPGAYRWAVANDHDWLLRHKMFMRKLLEVDLEAGSVVRTIWSEQPVPLTLYEEPFLGHMCLTRDSQYYILWNLERITRLRRDASRIDTFEISSLQAVRAFCADIAVSDDPAIVYGILYDRRIFICNLETGEFSWISSTPNLDEEGWHEITYDADARHLIEWPWPGDYNLHLPIRIRDAESGDILQEYTPSGQGRYSGFVDLAENRLYAAVSQNEIEVRELQTGRLIRQIEKPGTGTRFTDVTTTPDARNMMISVNDPTYQQPGTVWLYDQVAGQWVGRCEADSGVLFNSVASPSGKRIVVQGMDANGERLVVFDLEH